MKESVSYQATLGVVVARGPNTAALLIQAVGEIYTPDQLGVNINNVRDEVLPITAPIEATLEELITDPKRDFDTTTLYKLHWTGYAYKLKDYTGVAKPPLLVVSNPSKIDLSRWEEVTTTSVIEEINRRVGGVDEG